MKEICKCADAFVQKCSIKDFALLKICLCAVGIMVGLSIPEKKEKMASYGRRLCFHFQLYIDYGEICENLYGRTLKRFRTIKPIVALFLGRTGCISFLGETNC